MLAPIEIVAALAVIVLLGGGHVLGAFDPILGAIGEGWSFLKRQFNSGNGTTPISINNRDVEQSDTNVEVHFHYHGVEEREVTSRK